MLYPEKEKVFFLRRMWADGLTPRAAERRWGRPSRSSLSAWEAAALAGELEAERPPVKGACGHEERGAYPPETGAEAVRRLLAGEKPAHVARPLGLESGRAVSAWARAARAKMPAAGAAGAPGTGGTSRFEAAGLRGRLHDALGQARGYLPSPLQA